MPDMPVESIMQSLDQAHASNIQAITMISNIMAEDAKAKIEQAKEIAGLKQAVSSFEQTQQRSNEIMHRYNNIRQQEVLLDGQKLDNAKAEQDNKKKFYEKIGSIFEKPKDLIIFIAVIIGNLMLLFGAGDKGLILTFVDAIKRLGGP